MIVDLGAIGYSLRASCHGAVERVAETDLEGCCGRSRIDAARARTMLKRPSVLSNHRTITKDLVAVGTDSTGVQETKIVSLSGDSCGATRCLHESAKREPYEYKKIPLHESPSNDEIAARRSRDN